MPRGDEHPVRMQTASFRLEEGIRSLKLCIGGSWLLGGADAFAAFWVEELPDVMEPDITFSED